VLLHAEATSKYRLTTKRTKDTKDSEISSLDFITFVLFVTFVVKYLFRFWCGYAAFVVNTWSHLIAAHRADSFCRSSLLENFPCKFSGGLAPFGDDVFAIEPDFLEFLR
jgi:hypothetical protein